MEITTNVKDVIENYGTKSEFASFLPGIAGLEGIPMWCYLVNRGQAVVSFGVQDKDHSIMEFYPAHTAYQMVGRTGFRTFIKADNKYFEPFKNPLSKTKMTFFMNSLTIEDEDQENEIKVKISYSSLPGEKIASLMRVTEITNLSAKRKDFEILDGMPAVIPFGVDQESMKMMAQTTKAWMQVEDVESKVPYYRVRVSMEDSAVVKKVEGGNFALGMLEDGTGLPVIVDPHVVFSYDLGFDQAVGFREESLENLLEEHQNTSNELPSAFFAKKASLEGNETIVLYEMIGQVRNKEVLNQFLQKKIDGEYFKSKFAEATELTENLTSKVATKTANPVFDNYTRYNYMDNVLRGGTPIKLGDKHTYYVYSRKHGDLERDYNYFSMSPEFYSQGNGNFRDVNQNRRCDTFFSPIVKSKNIQMFYSLIQLDGYNPLKIEQMRYVSEKAGALDLSQPFTPGELAAAIMDEAQGEFEEKEKKLFREIMADANDTVNADFGEGYWSDHWTYNLDLIEDFLEVYPDQAKELLFDIKVKSFDAKEKLRPRFARYAETENGIRQYYYLEKRDNTSKNPSYAVDKSGKDISMSVMAKLVLMSAIKLATLDAYGLGVEMEGGKPGWYDALNGLPGLLGSSMNEAYELARMIAFVKDNLTDKERIVEFPAEVANFIKNVYAIEKDEVDSFEKWNRKNDIKEEYRGCVYEGFSGNTVVLNCEELSEIFEVFNDSMHTAVSKAVEIGDGIAPAYFTYEIDEYEKSDAGIIPKHFNMVSVPYFLEGPVRFLKLGDDIQAKKAMYEKVNASLQNASFELGRCRAFTPGWLENESIWLHMEYKYLLELIKSGLYKEFFEDFRHAAVPFLDKDTYGRSTLENSSFIASSKNPNERIHGKGFVARLSGSTIEFISMWKHMFFGKNIFTVNSNGQLIFSLAPAIPEYLIAEEDGKYTVSTTLLGETKLIYQFPEKKDYIPGEYTINSISVLFEDGSEAAVSNSVITGSDAERIRNRQAKTITVVIA